MDQYQVLIEALKAQALTKDVLKTFILQCPMGTAALFLILNSLGFFLIGGLLQKSYWIIDATWIAMPLLISVGWRQNPYASKSIRGDIVIVLLAFWTLMTYCSYF